MRLGAARDGVGQRPTIRRGGGDGNGERFRQEYLRWAVGQ